jgi:deazaflavin-dependent oxidoreductase (nitroreductase family)
VSTSPADFNAKVIDAFRAGGGEVEMLAGMPLLLLHHRGARSGVSHVTPLAFLKDGERYVIFGSAAGSPRNPGWYHNLVAHPEVSIEVGTDTLQVTAKQADGSERDRLFASQCERVPQFAEYAQMTDRAIPVILLTPSR